MTDLLGTTTAREKALAQLNKPAEQILSEYLQGKEKARLKKVEAEIKEQSERKVSILDHIPWVLPPHLQHIGAADPKLLADGYKRNENQRIVEELLMQAQIGTQERDGIPPEQRKNKVRSYVARAQMRADDNEEIKPFLQKTSELPFNLSCKVTAAFYDGSITYIESLIEERILAELPKEEAVKLRKLGFKIKVVNDGHPQKPLEVTSIARDLAYKSTQYIWNKERHIMIEIGSWPKQGWWLDYEQGKKYLTAAGASYHASIEGRSEDQKVLKIDVKHLPKDVQDKLPTIDYQIDLPGLVYYFQLCVAIDWLGLSKEEAEKAIAKGWKLDFLI